MQRIKSILDTDMYKLSMQQAVLELYPDAVAEYRFFDRKGMPFPSGMARKELWKLRERLLESIQVAVTYMQTLRLEDSEVAFLREIPFFKPWYVEYLRNYRFDPGEVAVTMDIDLGELSITVRGLWHRTILWEVPLLAIVSECFYSIMDGGAKPGIAQEARSKAQQKATALRAAGVKFAEFGTRRRRSLATHELICKQLQTDAGASFVGTSNVALARDLDVIPIGTMAHEWVMGISALESLRHANRYALRQWMKVYQGRLGIALTDTFGTDAFWKDFDVELSRAYDGVRHDSGSPDEFAEAAIRHYERNKIDPRGKAIIFSDGLDVAEAERLHRKFDGRIKVSFGIGTHLTNDYDSCRALSIVMKLWSIDGIPVVKLSDVEGKEMGDPEARRVAKWVFGRKKVDFPVTLTRPVQFGSFSLDSEDVLWAYERRGSAYKLRLDEESPIPGDFVEGRDFVRGHEYAVPPEKYPLWPI